MIDVVDESKNNGKVKINKDEDKDKINKDKNNDRHVVPPTTIDDLHEAINKSTTFRGSDGLQLPLVVFIKRGNEESLGEGWLRTLISGPFAVGHLSSREKAILSSCCTMLCGRGWGEWAKELASAFDISQVTVRIKHKEYLTNSFAAGTERPARGTERPARGPKRKDSERKVNSLEGGSQSGTGTPPLNDEADGLVLLRGVPPTRQAEEDIALPIHVAETSNETGTRPLNDEADGLAPHSPTQTEKYLALMLQVAESRSDNGTPTLDDEADHLAPIYTANERFESPPRNDSSGVAPSNEQAAPDLSNENTLGGIGRYFLSSARKAQQSVNEAVQTICESVFSSVQEEDNPEVMALAVDALNNARARIHFLSSSNTAGLRNSREKCSWRFQFLASPRRRSSKIVRINWLEVEQNTFKM